MLMRTIVVSETAMLVKPTSGTCVAVLLITKGSGMSINMRLSQR